MDRPLRSQAAQQLVRRVLLRQFLLRSAVGLALAGLCAWVARLGDRVLVSLAISGGWMLANCAAMVWVGLTLVTRHATSPTGAVVGLMATILGSLALGSWVIVASHPSLVGVAAGFLVPVVIFLYQGRRLTLDVGPDAR